MRPHPFFQLALPLQSAPGAASPSENAAAENESVLDIEGVDEQPFEVEDEPKDDPSRRGVPSAPERLERARSLAEAISKHVKLPVQLSVTDNRSTMISYRRVGGRLLLRVHHMFLNAPEHVVRAVADYTGRSRREASSIIDAFVSEHAANIRVGRGKSTAARLFAQGKAYDLREIFERINDAAFDGRIDARIGWGRILTSGRRRSIRMGVYDKVSRTIRIHPALDRPEVPRFFVEYIVFHEMLHQAIPCRSKGSRQQHHGPEFRRRERAWPDYERAVAWERENLSLLLGKRAGRRARPVER